MPKPEPAFSEDAKSIETKSRLGSKESARFFPIVYELGIEGNLSCEVVLETCTHACWGLVDFVQVRAGQNGTDFERKNNHKKAQKTQKFFVNFVPLCGYSFLAAAAITSRMASALGAWLRMFKPTRTPSATCNGVCFALFGWFQISILAPFSARSRITEGARL